MKIKYDKSIQPLTFVEGDLVLFYDQDHLSPFKTITFQNPDFDTFSQQSLVRTRSDSFVTEIFLDLTILQPRTPEVLSPTAKPQITPSVLSSIFASLSSVTTSPIIQSVIPPPPHIMVARYAPLVLTPPLHAMPQDYQMRLP
jgi:hypothetical protein